MLEETTATWVAGMTDKRMALFKGWEVKHLQAWEQPEKRGCGCTPGKHRLHTSSATN